MFAYITYLPFSGEFAYKNFQQHKQLYYSHTDMIDVMYSFLQSLRAVFRLIAVGEEFCCSKSEDLHDSIRTQTVKYFKTYHRSRMDELRMFLENEAWELCPVKASFKIVDLSVSVLECSFLSRNFRQTTWLRGLPVIDHYNQSIFFSTRENNHSC